MARGKEDAALAARAPRPGMTSSGDQPAALGRASTRERILDVALYLFTYQCFDCTSMR